MVVSNPTGTGRRVAAPILMFGFWGVLMGLVFFLGTNYPCFFWIVDNATRCGTQPRLSGAGVVEID